MFLFKCIQAWPDSRTLMYTDLEYHWDEGITVIRHILTSEHDSYQLFVEIILWSRILCNFLHLGSKCLDFFKFLLSFRLEHNQSWLNVNLTVASPHSGSYFTQSHLGVYLGGPKKGQVYFTSYPHLVIVTIDQCQKPSVDQLSTDCQPIVDSLSANWLSVVCLSTIICGM